MAKQNHVIAALRERREGLTYEELRSRAASTDRSVFDREVVAALRSGEIEIRCGRYVAQERPKD